MSYGRGGAGNMSKDDPLVTATSISTTAALPSGTYSPRNGRIAAPKQQESFATGRGGTGNVARNGGDDPNGGRLPLSMSLSLSRSMDRSSSRSGSVSTGSSGARRQRYGYGRGGAANIACEDEDEIRRLTIRPRAWERDDDDDRFEEDEEEETSSEQDKTKIATVNGGAKNFSRIQAAPQPSRGRVPEKEWKESERQDSKHQPHHDGKARERDRERERERASGRSSSDVRPSARQAVGVAVSPAGDRGISVQKGVQVERVSYRAENGAEWDKRIERERARPTAEPDIRGLADVGRDFLGRRLKVGRKKKKSGEQQERW